MESTTYPVSTLPDVSSSSPGWPLAAQIAIGVTASIVTLVTILGNFSVLCAFARTPRLHTYANFYIVSLASVDFLGGLVGTLPHGAYWLLGYWPFGDKACFIYKLINSCTFHITYLATVVIALDRYFSIAYPLRHLKYRTAKVALCVILATYATPVLMWGPFYFYWRYGYDGSFRVPPLMCYPLYLSNIYITVGVVCVQNWTPLFLMIIVYIRVYRIARDAYTKKTSKAIRESASVETVSKTHEVSMADVDLQPAARVNPAFEAEDLGGDNKGVQIEVPSRGRHESRMKKADSESGRKTSNLIPESGYGGQDGQEDVSSKSENRRGNKALRTLTPIFISMMASGLPWAVIAIITVLCSKCLPEAVSQTAVYLCRTCSAMNPFCYAIANPLYRQAFLKIVCSGQKQKH